MNDEKKPVEENEELCENEAETEVSTEEISEKKEKNAAFANLMGKTAVFGKKVAGGIQKGAGAISTQTKKIVHEIRVEKYSPLFKEEFKSKKFKIPNVIQIVDDAVRRDIDVCEGAIGWRDTVDKVEILYLYDEFVKESKIDFAPFPKCDAVYCVDPFDHNRFINVENIFERATNERLAELEHIAYCLGAKSFSVEIVESKLQTDDMDLSISSRTNSNSKIEDKEHNVSIDREGVKTSRGDREKHFSRKDVRSGKNTTYFEGTHEPQQPTLKWYAHDENIKGLIEMRCSGNNSIKSKTLELRGSTTTTMSQKNACAIDRILKVKALAKKTSYSHTKDASYALSLEKKTISEYNSVLYFEVEF